MFAVYWIAMIGVGAPATDFVNDKIFDEGFHIFGNAEYTAATEEFSAASLIVDGYNAYIDEHGSAPTGDFEYAVTDDKTLDVTYESASLADYESAKTVFEKYSGEEPDPAEYARYIPSVPTLIESGLDLIHTADWLKALILDGIVAGVGAVLGFVPQMLVLFLMLAFLEACGYMARIAFVLDRIFRKFGLSGKSFIPMLVGTGCGVPGTVDLVADNGDDAYGVVMDKVFILSCDEYRKYRKHVPLFEEWMWTCTPWWIDPYSGNGNNVRYVYTTGGMNHYYADSSYGVAPACVFSSKNLKLRRQAQMVEA